MFWFPETKFCELPHWASLTVSFQLTLVNVRADFQVAPANRRDAILFGFCQWEGAFSFGFR